jgi:hypothetical protein
LSTDRHSSMIEWAQNQTTIIQTIYGAVCGIIHCRTLVVLSRRPLVLSSRRPLILSSRCYLVFSPHLSSSSRSCTTLSSSHCAGWLLLRCLLSRHRLVLSSSRRAALSSSCLPLTAPPSRHLITPSGCCVNSRRCWVKSPNGFCDFLATTI